MFESIIVSGQIHLGKQGEHRARRFSFQDFVIWKEIFGEGTCELIHQRNGDSAPYPVAMTIEDGVPYWCVTEVDTAIAGVGKCEIRYIVDDVVVKSNIYTTFVQEALGEGTEEPPEPQKAWVDQVFEAEIRAKQSADDAKTYADTAARSAEEAEETATFVKDAIGGINTSFANALKGTVKGRGAVRMDDISPLPHNIDIKLKRINLINESAITGSVYKFNVEVGKTYTFSCKVKADADIVTDMPEVGVWNYTMATNENIIINGTVEKTSATFTVAEGDDWLIETTVGAITDYLEHIQLEEGSTASAYAPYVEDLENVKFKSYGKNLLDFTKTYPRNNSDTIEVIDKDTIRWQGSYWFILPVSIPAGATFRISMGGFEVESGTCKGFIKWYMEYTDGTSSEGFQNVYTATAEKNVKRLFIYKNPAAGLASVVIKNYQVEIGDTKTAYESYKEPVEGVVIVQPTTTIVVDTPGVAIEATYNRDINKAFAELQNALISMGVNV